MIVELGQGTNPMFTNSVCIDVREYESTDMVHDLNDGIPLDDGEVSSIYAHHVIEHLDSVVDIMNEIHRVCRDGAKVSIKVPYYRHHNAYDDPTHKHYFTKRSFDYWDSTTSHGDREYFNREFRVERVDHDRELFRTAFDLKSLSIDTHMIQLRELFVPRELSFKLRVVK